MTPADASVLTRTVNRLSSGICFRRAFCFHFT